MSPNEYFEEIESLEFQIQFSVVGGLKILQMAMDQHPTLVKLRSAIKGIAGLDEEVYRRILHLLSKVDRELQLSYDESIAAYLFCLSKEKPFTAYRASWSILDHGGLWWSVQLAHFLRYYDGQIIENIDASTVNADTDSFVSAVAEDDDDKMRLAVSYVKGDLVLESSFNCLQESAVLRFCDLAWGNSTLTIPNMQFFCSSNPNEERQTAIELVR